MKPLPQGHFDHLHNVLFTEPPKNAPRFFFDPATQSWRPHKEIAHKIPQLVNPDYVDAEPLEMWIDFATGEVKETSIRQTSPSTQLENG
jgi:hypothetical protein